MLIVPGWRRLWAALGPVLDRTLPRAYQAMGYLLGSSQVPCSTERRLPIAVRGSQGPCKLSS